MSCACWGCAWRVQVRTAARTANVVSRTFEERAAAKAVARRKRLMARQNEAINYDDPIGASRPPSSTPSLLA